MARIQKQWIESGAIGSDAITIENDQFLKGRNAADNADVNIIKVDASDELQLAAKLKDVDSSAPTADAQLANKKYVDDSISSVSLPTVFELQGNWQADINSPTLANTDTGVDNFLYYVNVAGSTDFGAGSIDFAVGDWVYFANGTWNKADNNDDVLTVNGQSGTVVLTTSDIAEGTNEYFTIAKARSAAVVNSTAGSETDQAPSVASIKTYIAGEISGLSQNFATEKFTLLAGDITNGYVDLSNTPIDGSIHVIPKGGLTQDEGVDYTVSTNRITFAGDLATYLVAGNDLIIKYAF